MKTLKSCEALKEVFAALRRRSSMSFVPYLFLTVARVFEKMWPA